MRPKEIFLSAGCRSVSGKKNKEQVKDYSVYLYMQLLNNAELFNMDVLFKPQSNG